MGLGREVGAAFGCLTALGPPAGATRAALAGGLAFYPTVGLALGAVAAAVAGAVALVSASAAGPAGVLVLAALGGGRGTLALAAAATALLGSGTPAERLGRLRATPPAPAIGVAVVVLLARAAAAAVLSAPARTTALVAAPMLGGWAIVVQCYGGTPEHARGPAAALVGRARFREFAWASVVALGVTLAAGEAVGLVVVLAASVTTVVVRVLAHARVGGLTGRLLWATRELVETSVVGTLALVARLLS